MNSRMCRGGVSHARVEPVAHQFTYPISFCLFDVDELPRLALGIPIFGHNRSRPIALHDTDYLTPGPAGLRTKLAELLGDAAPHAHRVFLLTCPRLLGYAFNPISIFWCLGCDGSLRNAVLQVANTYGEDHLYVLRDPEPSPQSAAVRFRAAKQFFVSPFNDLKGEYRVLLSPPGDEVSAAIELWREDRLLLATKLWGRGVAITASSLALGFARGGLGALLTRARIAQQALILRYVKGLRDHMRPRPSSPLTFPIAARRDRGRSR